MGILAKTMGNHHTAEHLLRMSIRLEASLVIDGEPLCALFSGLHY